MKMKKEELKLKILSDYKLEKDKELGDFYAKETENSVNVVVLDNLSIDCAIPLIDNRELIKGVRMYLNEDQGIVEAVNTKTKNNEICAYTILKQAMQPSGMMYILTLQILRDNYLINVHGEFIEHGMIGMRDATIFGALGGKLNEWAFDPYDKRVKKGMLMNKSELKEFDDKFPNHPLSEARKFVEYVLENN